MTGDPQTAHKLPLVLGRLPSWRGATELNGRSGVGVAVGNVIKVVAVDDFEVESVSITIRDAANASLRRCWVKQAKGDLALRGR